MDALFELARRDNHVPLSNSLKPHVARLLRDRNPDLRARIKVKPLGRKKKTFTLADLRRARAGARPFNQETAGGARGAS
jgi:hypothetical protein